MIKTERIIHSDPKYSYLQLTGANFSCKIAPGFGASLQEYIYKENPIIKGVSIDEEGRSDYLKAYSSAILFPFANRIQDGKYRFGEEEYQLEINDVQNHNAIHGLVADQVFEVIKIHEESKETIVTLQYESDGKIKGCPFKYQLQITYTITTSGTIVIRMTVLNKDSKEFPFSMGWHPYFYTEDIAISTLETTIKNSVLCDKRMIPITEERVENFSKIIGKQTFDNAFILKENRVVWKTSTYQMTMTHDSINKYLQLYTPNDRQSIAIEPMTANIDVFNNHQGLQILAPGEEYQWTIQLQINT